MRGSWRSQLIAITVLGRAAEKFYGLDNPKVLDSDLPHGMFFR